VADAHQHFPSDLRGGLLRWFSDQQVGANLIWGAFAQGQGYGTVEDYVRSCDRRLGDSAEATCRARMDDQWALMVQQTPKAQGADPQTLERVRLSKAHVLLLHAMCDSDFARALEAASKLAVERLALADMGFGYDYVGTVIEHVNSLLELRGVPYRLDRELTCVFTGDKTLHDVAVAPALAALADPRLAGARSEFEDALTKLGRGNPKDLEDTVEESRKAVESVMKVLIAEHALPLPTGKQTTKPLHDALVSGGVVEHETDNLVAAAARVANADASHGAGARVRVVRVDVATAVVSAAGVAITFLASRLP
jgi:hypothetical protein